MPLATFLHRVAALEGADLNSLTPARLEDHESPLAFSSLPSTGTIVTGHRALRRTYWLTVPGIAGLPGRAAGTTARSPFGVVRSLRVATDRAQQS